MCILVLDSRIGSVTLYHCRGPRIRNVLIDHPVSLGSVAPPSFFLSFFLSLTGTLSYSLTLLLSDILDLCPFPFSLRFLYFEVLRLSMTLSTEKRMFDAVLPVSLTRHVSHILRELCFSFALRSESKFRSSSRTARSIRTTSRR